MANDILLDKGGDIALSDAADITVRRSIRQEVKIFLLWFFEEWRFAPPLGVPYFEDVFIKNPDKLTIARIMRSEAGKAQGVKDVRDVRVTVNNATRDALITFTLVTDYGEYREELNIHV